MNLAIGISLHLFSLGSAAENASLRESGRRVQQKKKCYWVVRMDIVIPLSCFISSAPFFLCD